jgi:hypothetical protein
MEPSGPVQACSGIAFLLFRSGWSSKSLGERLSVNTGCTAGGCIAVLTGAPAVRSPKCPRVITVLLAVKRRTLGAP